MAKDSAEKGLSEEAVKLFDLAKVHVHLFYTDISFTKDQYFYMFICGHEFTYKFMILCFFIFFLYNRIMMEPWRSWTNFLVR